MFGLEFSLDSEGKRPLIPSAWSNSLQGVTHRMIDRRLSWWPPRAGCLGLAAALTAAGWPLRARLPRSEPGAQGTDQRVKPVEPCRMNGARGRLHHRHIVGTRSRRHLHRRQGPHHPHHDDEADQYLGGPGIVCDPGADLPSGTRPHETEHERSERPAGGYFPRTRLKGVRGSHRHPQQLEEYEEGGGHGCVAGDGREYVPEHSVPPLKRVSSRWTRMVDEANAIVTPDPSPP